MTAGGQGYRNHATDVADVLIGAASAAGGQGGAIFAEEVEGAGIDLYEALFLMDSCKPAGGEYRVAALMEEG
jgi:hypothetical protein